jgi:CRISPR-associated protein Csb2
MSAGVLDMLIDRYGEDVRRRHSTLSEQIASLKAEKKLIRGQGAADGKAKIDERIINLTEELDVTIDRPPLRPCIGLWSGYRSEAVASGDKIAVQTHFDADLLVLNHTNGPRLPLVSTLEITHTLRDTIMKGSGVQPVPAWVSGHESNGDPLRDAGGHLALIPLPFVGCEHADGHLLGVGLIFPRTIDRRERGRVLGRALLNDDGQPKQVALTLGRMGVWVVQKRDWSDRRQALQPETWTAHPNGADTWASVTPVVLDRFPKEDRVLSRADWAAEVAEIICEACGRIGLPRPTGVDVDTTSWHAGSPRAVAKRRRLRGQGAIELERGGVLGDGFPPYPAKRANASRPQVHAWVRFAEPVIGPILLGAGRYRGYGLFKPWKEGRS